METNAKRKSGQPQQTSWEKFLTGMDKFADFLDKLGTLFERVDKVLLRGIATAITFSAIIDVVIILAQHINKIVT